MEIKRLSSPANPVEVGPSSRPDYQEEIQSPAPDPESVQPESQAPDPGTKISQPRKGRKHSPEARAKMSEAQKGKKLSPEHKAKIGRASKGKKHSQEARAKMSEAQKGKKHSQEARARIGEAQKGEKNHLYDQNIDKVHLAIAAHVRGESMVQASRNQGFHKTWLAVWKCKHPERFQMLYRQAADELDRVALKREIGAYVSGLSPGETGLSRNQAGIRLARRALRLCYDEDLSTAEASQELGLDPGWLDQYQQTHPLTCQKLNSVIQQSRP